MSQQVPPQSEQSIIQKTSADRLSLLLLSLDYPPNDGGISRLAGGLIQALLDTGCALRVVTFPAGNTKGLPRPATDTLEIAHRKGLRDLQILRAVRDVGRETPILATVWNPEATLAMLTGARRVSILAHGNEVMEYTRQPLGTWLRRRIMERAHVVICNSRFTETLVQKIAPAARTAVLNPAIDAARFCVTSNKLEARQRLELASSKKIVLTVARLDEIKGHETVLRAIAALTVQQRRNLLYVIIGKGYMREQLMNLTKSLQIEEQVQFAGFVADDDLPVWYRACDLFVLPSVVDPTRRGMEGFGIAVAEAQAAGLAVIGTRSGGIPDAVREGEGGWLIDERDAEALAVHLIQLLAAPEVFEEQGRLGAARMQREFSWDEYASRLLELI